MVLQVAHMAVYPTSMRDPFADESRKTYLLLMRDPYAPTFASSPNYSSSCASRRLRQRR